MFELVPYVQGGRWLPAKGASVCLEDAVNRARDLISSDEAIYLVEIRKSGAVLASVGIQWLSRPVGHSETRT